MNFGIIDAGSATCIDWDLLDKALMKWAKEYFGSPFAKAKAERDDDSSCVIRVYDLDDSDENAFRVLYQKYDPKCEYELEADLSEIKAKRSCTLPAGISTGVISAALSGIKVGTIIANYGSVLILSKKIDLDTPLDTGRSCHY